MIGNKLSGRYEILDRIGSGGMAVAYRARDHVLNRTVAIKVLKTHLADDEDLVRRFRREAQAAAGLAHPNVVSIYDVGKEENTHFMVMECVEGQTLKDKIKEKGRMDPEDAVETLLQICEALQHAHSSGVIHRDVKPQNILISESGQVKVTDFGIAVAANVTNTLTYSHSITGSVHYFSPEQARGGGVGEQSDIYSLGIVLYEMLTGEVPYSGESPISIALKHLNEKVIPPSEIYPEVPSALDKVVLKLVQKEPSRRYGSVNELKEDLKLWQKEKRVKIDYPEEHEDGDLENTIVSLPVDESSWYRDRNMENEHQNSKLKTKDSINDSKLEREKTGGGRDNKKPLWKQKWLLAILVGIILLGAVTGAGLAYARLYYFRSDVETPPVEGKTLEEAEEALLEAGFTESPEVYREHHNEVPEGKVFSQAPNAGDTVKEHRQVELGVSLGTDTVEVPDLEGKTGMEARNNLENQGLQYEIVPQEHEEVSEGIIIRQSPQPGVSVEEEAVITVYESEGPPDFPLSDLTGMDLEEAEEYLEEEGLIMGIPEYETSDEPEDEVIDQDPRPGAAVSQYEEVVLVVSEGPEEDEDDEKDNGDNGDDGEDNDTNGDDDA